MHLESIVDVRLQVRTLVSIPWREPEALLVDVIDQEHDLVVRRLVTVVVMMFARYAGERHKLFNLRWLLVHVATHPGLLVDVERISLDLDTDLRSVPCAKLLQHVGHLLVEPVEDHRWSLMLRLRVEFLLVLWLLMLNLIGIGE